MLSFMTGSFIFIYCVQIIGNISVLFLSFLSRSYNFVKFASVWKGNNGL
jgi:hypothetical protein